MEIKDSSGQYIKNDNKDDYVLNSNKNKSKNISFLKWRLGNRKKRAIFFLIVVLFFLVWYKSIKKTLDVRFSRVLIPRGYLVWSDNCKMPDIDPYSSEVMTVLQRKKFVECPSYVPLTQVIFNATVNKYILLMNEEKVYNLSAEERLCLTCCYIVMKRKLENLVKYSTCLKFKEPVTLSVDMEHILIRCRIGHKPVYYGGYTMMPERDKLRKLLKDWKINNTQKPLNVILLGIDSISRVNFISAMPKTAQYLYDNDWFEMSGYNKMGHNTFPNLMAILTGFNESSVEEQCNPTQVGGLDRCPFIWKTFRKRGYATAYAEDNPTFSTFNYAKNGFNRSPVDYYFRPFILGAEGKLPVTQRSSIPYCIGSKPEAFYVFDYALELDARYGNDRYFGLFWTNTCHGDVNDVSLMDDSFYRYLRKFAHRGVLERSVVIFFSDHGVRWGPARRTVSGYFDSRRPFLFIWLPLWLRYTRPDFVKGLLVNNNRLTSPYDLHMTLKHILEISSHSDNLPHAQDCPNCQSLLKPVPDNRSCADAGIPELWCTCSPLFKTDKDSYQVKKIVDLSILYVNTIITDYNEIQNEPYCREHSLVYIANALTYTVPNNDTSFVYYVILFLTNQNRAVFETVVKFFTITEEMEILGVSRVSPESKYTYMILDPDVRQFC